MFIEHIKNVKKNFKNENVLPPPPPPPLHAHTHTHTASGHDQYFSATSRALLEISLFCHWTVMICGIALVPISLVQLYSNGLH